MPEPVFEQEGGTGEQTKQANGDEVESNTWHDVSGEPVSSGEHSYLTEHHTLSSADVSRAGATDLRTSRPSDSGLEPTLRSHPSGSDESTTELDRRYECLDCEHAFGSFKHECPNCGGTAFCTGSDGPEHDPGMVDAAVEEFVRLTAPFNPYVPR